MLSRENRILSELIVSRGLATPEAVERRARELPEASDGNLVDALLSHAELDPNAAQSLRDEAREIDGLLRTELPEGRTLGEYRLVREIGRGGMGIVYEAEQLSLGRRVALKVLPAGAALDEQLSIRFLREARSAARMTHPGIVPVFGTGHEQGVLFFAMELVDGETLAEAIARGPQPAREAARIASQIAHALQYAHDTGLIHRDVKPENVILGKDGRARLADFGLVHDLHAARLTRSQYVLGTPAYTAPEQMRDAAVDARVDVYGAGAVLYAMLAGRPPFSGEVPAAVLARLIGGPPPALAAIAPGTPAALIAICEEAMARELERRYPSARLLAEALDTFLEATRADRPGAATPGASPDHPRSLPALLAAGILAVLVVALFWLDRAAEGPAAIDGTLQDAGVVEGMHRFVPTPPGAKSEVALSPDGETVAYATAPKAKIFLQRVGEIGPWPLIDNEEPQSRPAWSPDGSKIAYCRSSTLEIVHLASAAVQPTSESCGPMSWSPDGTRIVYADLPAPATRLRVFDTRSGDSRLVSGPGAMWPNWSAAGRIAFVALRDGQYDVWTVREDGSDVRRVTNDVAREVYPAWSSRPGVLFYGSNRHESHDLWTVRLDPATGEVLSAPMPVSRIWFGAPFRLAVARKRDRLAFVHEIELTQAWVLRLGPDARPLGPPKLSKLDIPSDVTLPKRSPVAEEWIAVARRGTAENLQRFGMTSDAEWITAGPYRDAAPCWAPDGRSIAFHSDRSGTNQIWTVRADGSGLDQVTMGPDQATYPIWSPDGARLAFTVAGNGAWVKTLAAGNPTRLRDGFEPWSWSADGRRLAGTERTEGAVGGIIVLSVADGGTTQVASYGERPSWIGATGELLFTHENRIIHWSGAGEPSAIWSSGPISLSSRLSLSADGREVSFATAVSRERVGLLDLDAPSGGE